MPSSLRRSDVTVVDPACFLCDTLVHCEGGEVGEIQWIGAGAKVLSRCEMTGELAYRLVTRKLERAAAVSNIFFRRDGDDREVMIAATPEHPFWIRDRGWVLVRYLASGDVIQTFDRRDVVVDYVEEQADELTVYNLEVEGFHTYFVGRRGLWVHNTCSAARVSRGGT
jgi:hypothetical protein